jgi:hypothetical protein
MLCLEMQIDCCATSEISGARRTDMLCFVMLSYVLLGHTNCDYVTVFVFCVQKLHF